MEAFETMKSLLQPVHLIIDSAYIREFNASLDRVYSGFNRPIPGPSSVGSNTLVYVIRI
jgi:hypothetical protein